MQINLYTKMDKKKQQYDIYHRNSDKIRYAMIFPQKKNTKHSTQR